MRKLRELLITRRLEVELSKQRILEIYLNVIEWGDGVWGAEAAARTLLRQVRPPSSAATNRPCWRLRSPTRTSFDPGQPTARLRRRQQMIMRRMGAVTPPPVVAEPLPPAPPDTGEVPIAAARGRRGCPASRASVEASGPRRTPRKSPGEPRRLTRSADLGSKSLFCSP